MPAFQAGSGWTGAQKSSALRMGEVALWERGASLRQLSDAHPVGKSSCRHAHIVSAGSTHFNAYMLFRNYVNISLSRSLSSIRKLVVKDGKFQTVCLPAKLPMRFVESTSLEVQGPQKSS